MNKRFTTILLSTAALSAAMIMAPTITHHEVVHADTSALGATATSGTWGTSSWNFNTSNGTLTLQGGTLGEGASAPWTNGDIDGTQINKIVFENKVFAPINSKNLFSDLSAVTSIEGLSNLDTSNVTNMASMFYHASALKSLDLSGFDTSQVTNMSEMFDSASALTSLDLSSFDTSNVTSMKFMFNGADSLTSLNLSGFDTSQVTNMSAMFQSASSLTSLDVSHFDTSRVSDISFMFCGTDSLTSLDVSHFDTSRVKDMSSMFQSASSLTSLDLSSFVTSKVTTMVGMLSNNEVLSQIKLGSNFNFGSSAGLSEPNPETTTGKWQNVGSGTPKDPKGSILWTSAQLMDQYTGAAADTYVWQKKDEAVGNVTVKYVDEQGKTIAPDVTLSGKVGSSYTSTQKTISGYTFSKVQGNAQGTFTDKAQTVTYIYKKNSTPTPTPDVKYQAVYRLYNKNTGEHFYTESAFERDSLVKGGWNNEGTGWSAPTKGSAVYRVYNPNAKGGDHYYTASQYEAQSLVKGGWKWDNSGKPVFYSGGKTKIYVAFNPNATASGSHNYTSSAYEQQSLLKSGWKYGSVQFYGK